MGEGGARAAEHPPDSAINQNPADRPSSSFPSLLSPPPSHVCTMFCVLPFQFVIDDPAPGPSGPAFNPLWTVDVSGNVDVNYDAMMVSANLRVGVGG